MGERLESLVCKAPLPARSNSLVSASRLLTFIVGHGLVKKLNDGDLYSSDRFVISD